MTKEEILAIMRAGVGATYVRVSDDRQETQRQRDILDRWLAPLDIKIKQQFRFEDEGFSRDLPDLRPGFQRMLAFAEKGLIQWVAADVQDRFGTKNKFQFIAFMHQLREAKCHFITADWKCWTSDDFMAFIEGGMGAETSEKEQRSKSHRILTGKITRARRGEWQGGHISFGMDVACYGPDDVERWRVVIEGRTQIGTKTGKGGKPKRINAIRRTKVYPDGRTEVFEGHRTFPATEYNEVLRQTPSRDKTRLATVVEVFKKFATEATNYNVLADYLNRLGIKPYYASKWEHYHVRDMLDNPIYIGYQRFNSHGQGRFTEFVGGEERSVENACGGRMRPKEDWVLSEKPLFNPLVPQKIWEKVQAKLEAAPPERRSPRSADLWLRGLLYCSHCDQQMRGSNRSTRHEYFCSTYARDKQNATCLRHCVNHKIVEERIKQYLAEAGREAHVMLDVQKTGNLALLKPFEERHKAVFENSVEPLVKIMATLARHKGEGNKFLKQWVAANTKLDDDKPVPSKNMEQVATQFMDQFLPLQQVYETVFTQDAEGLRRKLAAIETDHTRLTENVLNLDPAKAKRAIEKANEKIGQLEEEMQRLERELVNYSDQFNSRNEELRAVSMAFDHAEAALDDPDAEARRKAEAVRAAIKRINVSFRPTGKKYPTSEVVDIEIVPVTPGDDGPECPNGGSI